jgi:hypothetical protein
MYEELFYSEDGDVQKHQKEIRELVITMVFMLLNLNIVC